MLHSYINLMRNHFSFRLISFVTIITLSCYGCAFKSVSRTKGITYLHAGVYNGVPDQKLNVFSPRKHRELKDVLVFIYGGNWNSGKRSLYSFLGNRMARKGIVTVIIDYPLGPQLTYREMVLASANALLWVTQNIKQYGGNPDKIFVSGHSAGGHIASLLTMDDQYFNSLHAKNPIAGAILIDAAGVDLYNYLKQRKLSADHHYIKTFTNDPKIWKEASSLYHIHAGMPPIKMYVGERTYPALKKVNEQFYEALKKVAPETQFKIVKRKKHIPMITQFFWTWNPIYDEIKAFMKSSGNSPATLPAKTSLGSRQRSAQPEHQ
jgi:acetyl esterase/lipase